MAGRGIRQRNRTLRDDAFTGSSSIRGPRDVDSTTANANAPFPADRERLLLERQEELRKVLDRHDDLIREKFHLEKFVSLLYYNPQEAKKDTSPVFEEYKLKHDLAMKTPSAGLSRTTRRAQNARISVLKNQSKPNAPASVKASQSISAPVHSSIKINGTGRHLPTLNSSALYGNSHKMSGKKGERNLSAVAKGKQKESISDDESTTGEVPFDSRAPRFTYKAKARATGRLSSSKPSRWRSATSEATENLTLVTASGSSFRQPRKNARDSNTPSAVSFDDSEVDFRYLSTTGKKSRLKHAISLPSLNGTRLTPSSSRSALHITIPASPSKSSIRLTRGRPTVSGKTLPTTSARDVAGEEPVVSQHRIKRIKLIVREPPPSISSPRQRPPVPQFGKSLEALMTSYTHVDGMDYDEDEFERAVQKKARLLNRIEDLKKEGRLLLDASTALDGFDEKIARSTRHPGDVWRIVVSEAIAARNILPRHKFGRGGLIASNICARYNAYQAGLKTKEEREAAAEGKRVRALAKTTLRIVIDRWKKILAAVLYQERLAREQEEQRLGRQHLDAILDQSGQILEKQQMELVRSAVLRGYSKSASASVDSDNEDEEETDEEEREDEGSVVNSVAEYYEDSARVVDGDNVTGDAISEVSDEDVGSSALLSRSLPRGRLEESPEPRTYLAPLNDANLEEELDHEVYSPEPDLTGARVVDARGSELADCDMNEEGYDEVEVVAQDNDFLESRNLLSAGDTDEEARKVETDDNGADEPLSTGTSQLSTPFIDELHLEANEFLRSSTSMDLDLYQLIQPENLHTYDDINGPVLMTRKAKSEKVTTSASFPVKADPSNDPTDPQASLSTPDDFELRRHVNGSVEISSPKSEFVSENTMEVPFKSNGNVNGSLSTTFEQVELLETQVVPNHESILPAADVPNEGRINSESKSLGASGGDDAEQLGEEHESERLTHERSDDFEEFWEPPIHLQPYAVARVNWDPEAKLVPPLLLRGSLRPYQQSGLEWLASLHNNSMNGILADEMGLGKTIQTIALLAHLACDRGIWGPHLIIVPTSVLLNWNMEFKKFLPGFNILAYHGNTKRRKELRKGWTDKYAFNVCVTSYTLASRDANIFKRKAWYYMILDEAHMIKNFKSQRWNTLLMFKSCRRLLLTGTPLQNNLTELWALLQFLMSGTKFVNLKEFGEWFSNPLEKAIEQGNVQDEEVQTRVLKLHTVLRPYLLRRLKRDVEKELPSKYEHLVLCRLSKRQRFLYDEFMSRAQTRDDLKSGVYLKIANILMQLRKVCNHPDLFEVRPIVTSFAMERSAISDYEIKELLVRRRLLEDDDATSQLDLDFLGLRFTQRLNSSLVAARAVHSLEDLLVSEMIFALPGEPPPHDLRTMEGFRRYSAYQRRSEIYSRYSHIAFINRIRCRQLPVLGRETVEIVRRLYNPLTAACDAEFRFSESPALSALLKSHVTRADESVDLINAFAFATPAAVARDMPQIALRELPADAIETCSPDFDSVLHRTAVKLQIAFPDASLLQYDCGKLQELARLLRERKSGGHRVLIFTQMTRILDILEIFLNYHGYLYLRLDGATKLEDREYITQRFNMDERVFAFISSSRSGGVGINLTGADTVIFYDSDFNPQMDRQCEDRAHRIGQVRDVHIYRFISQYTVEEAMLRKANQKRSLDDIVIQQGEFDWRDFFGADEEQGSSAIQKALVEFEDFEDAEAAKIAADEEAKQQRRDQADFADADVPADVDDPQEPQESFPAGEVAEGQSTPMTGSEERRHIEDYMMSFVEREFDFFREWKV